MYCETGVVYVKDQGNYNSNQDSIQPGESDDLTTLAACLACNDMW